MAKFKSLQIILMKEEDVSINDEWILIFVLFEYNRNFCMKNT